MHRYKTMSDAGGIAVGTRECWSLISNGRGDGYTIVAVFDSQEEFESFSGQHAQGFKFQTSVMGHRIEIPDYDCPSTKPWLDGSVHDWTPLVELDGSYSVYALDGTVAFVRFAGAPEI